MGAHEPQLEVKIAEDGSVRIAGRAAVPLLWRLVVAAKFQTELNAEHLLSPYVDLLLDELARTAPLPIVDWDNPAVLTPPGVLEAVEVVRRYCDQHDRGRDLHDLVQLALKPFDVPLERLSLDPPGSGPTCA